MQTKQQIHHVPECQLRVDHFPDKTPSPMSLNRVAFACDRQHSLDDHVDNWPLYATAQELLLNAKNGGRRGSLHRRVRSPLLLSMPGEAPEGRPVPFDRLQ